MDRGDVLDVEAEMCSERTVPAAPVERSCMGTLAALGSAVVSGVYLLNPTGGLIELIPDNVPVIGNLDEAGATVMLMYALRYLFRGPRQPQLPPP